MSRCGTVWVSRHSTSNRLPSPAPADCRPSGAALRIARQVHIGLHELSVRRVEARSRSAWAPAEPPRQISDAAIGSPCAAIRREIGNHHLRMRCPTGPASARRPVRSDRPQCTPTRPSLTLSRPTIHLPTSDGDRAAFAHPLLICTAPSIPNRRLLDSVSPCPTMSGRPQKLGRARSYDLVHLSGNTEDGDP